MGDTKICFKCGNELPIDEFYRHSNMADGRLNKCKACKGRDAKWNRLDNCKYYRAYDKARNKKPDRIRESVSRMARYRKDNPEKYKAHCKLNNALRNGAVEKKPCAICGEPQVEGHHEDYSCPLDVIWMCSVHHRNLHAGNLCLISEQLLTIGVAV